MAKTIETKFLIYVRSNDVTVWRHCHIVHENSKNITFTIIEESEEKKSYKKEYKYPIPVAIITHDDGHKVYENFIKEIKIDHDINKDVNFIKLNIIEELENGSNSETNLIRIKT